MALVGYMGSGKTTLGRALARGLRWEFFDLDREVERLAGMTIAEVFAQEGEARFRDLEARALADALGHTAERVVSCGGGAVLRPENRALLKNVPTVFLREEVEVLYARTRRPDRPLRGGSLEDFAARYEERLPLYEEVAGLVVDVGGRKRREILGQIRSWLAS